MDILESLYNDICAINSRIHAQDVQLERVINGNPKSKNTKSKKKLTKSRGALPIPSQRSKARLPTKPSMKKMPSMKSKTTINKSKSSKIIIKRKPMISSSSRYPSVSNQKPPPKRKEALPTTGRARHAGPPKKPTASATSNGTYHNIIRNAPIAKKPPTLTDSQPKLALRAEFRQHLEEIEKMKELLSENKEETQVLAEMNGVVSTLLNKSQNYLARADYTLRDADAQAPVHYKNILRKLLDNQSKTTIVMSPKPPPRKVPIYKKVQIQYSDRTQKDLDDLLKKHPNEKGPASHYDDFNFPDIFDRVYQPKSEPKKPEKDFDLTLFSPAKLIERAQQSLTSAVSAESISSFRREASLPQQFPTTSSNSSLLLSPKQRAPLKAEQDLDVLVQEVLDSNSQYTRRSATNLAGIPSSALAGSQPLSISTSHLVDTDTAANSFQSPLTLTHSPTKFPTAFPPIDDDLALLTPSLFTRKPAPPSEGEPSEIAAKEEKEAEFEMQLIRSSNQSERERIQGQMTAMQSRLDRLLSNDEYNGSGAAGGAINVEELLPKLAGQSNLQRHDDVKKLDDHENLLQKVVKTLMKKHSSKDKDKDPEKSERRMNRRANKIASIMGLATEDDDVDTAGGSSEGKEDSGNKAGDATRVPAPPAQRSAPSNQTPRTRKLARAVSLSTMHETEGEDEGDDDSDMTGSSGKKSKKMYGSSRTTEKFAAAEEAIRERARTFEQNRPTEVDMKF